jgi:hypothetical protein
MSGLDEAAVKAIYSALRSHAKKLAVFDRIEDHEPENAPGRGISAVFAEGNIGPAPSGLAATSLRWSWQARLMSPWVERPLSGVDPALTVAAVKLVASYALDIDLTAFGAPEGLVREIDVLGAAYDPRWMSQDGKEFRARLVSFALIVNDAFPQGVGGG